LRPGNNCSAQTGNLNPDKNFHDRVRSFVMRQLLSFAPRQELLYPGKKFAPNLEILYLVGSFTTSS
jgi:hypothetical protein